MDLHLMQDWTDAVNGSSQFTNREGNELQDTRKTNSSLDTLSPEAQRKTRSHISNMHECVWVQKNFFLLETQGELYEMIAADLSLKNQVNYKWTALKVHERPMCLKVYTSVKRISSICYTSNFLYTSLPCLRPILLVEG
jgi:hypothetical protein